MAQPAVVPRRGGGASALVGPAERESWAKDGAIILQNLLTPEEASNLRAAASADHRTLAARGKKIWVVDEKRGLDPDFPDVFTAVCHSQWVVEAVEAVLAAEIYIYHFKLVMKDAETFGDEAGRGENGWLWHQDWGYWHNDVFRLYPDMASISIALDPSTTSNGCLEILKGSHMLGRLDHSQELGERVADVERVALVRHY